MNLGSNFIDLYFTQINKRKLSLPKHDKAFF